jgi:hypothetical protein
MTAVRVTVDHRIDCGANSNRKSRELGTEHWMMGTIFTPLLAAISFAIDVFTGSANGNHDNLFQAAFFILG